MATKSRNVGGRGAALCIWLATIAATLAMPVPAVAGRPDSPAQLQAARHAVAQFEVLAGSRQNARSLVLGLRQGRTVTLLSPPSSPARQQVAFTPATSPMGYGNVVRALTLAQRELASRGIAKPAPEELQVMLMGGILRAGSGRSARVIRIAGILPLRSVHMRWGQVAHELAISPVSRSREAFRSSITP